MSSGERPMGAAKGKQSDTEALCQTPAPAPPPGSGPEVAAPTAPKFFFFHVYGNFLYGLAPFSSWGYGLPPPGPHTQLFGGARLPPFAPPPPRPLARPPRPPHTQPNPPPPGFLIVSKKGLQWDRVRPPPPVPATHLSSLPRTMSPAYLRIPCMSPIFPPQIPKYHFDEGDCSERSANLQSDLLGDENGETGEPYKRRKLGKLLDSPSFFLHFPLCTLDPCISPPPPSSVSSAPQPPSCSPFPPMPPFFSNLSRASEDLGTFGFLYAPPCPIPRHLFTTHHFPHVPEPCQMTFRPLPVGLLLIVRSCVAMATTFSIEFLGSQHDPNVLPCACMYNALP